MAATAYRLQDGTRVPSVTTINKLLSIGGNEGLIYWANQVGLAGKTLEEARKTTADVGSYAHHWMEANVKGMPYDPESVGMTVKQLELVMASHEQWDRWRRQTKIDFEHAEVSMVSEIHKYGGTADFVGKILDGEKTILVLGDLKTGGVYPEALMQIAAYGHLWEETQGGKIDEYVIIRVGKEDASFSYRNWRSDSDTIEKAWILFLTALHSRPLADQIQKAVRG